MPTLAPEPVLDPAAAAPPTVDAPWRLAVVRYGGEIGIKARATRKRLIARIERNLRDALASAGIPHRTRREWSFLTVESPAEAAMVEVASRTFGVGSVALSEERAYRDLDDLARLAEELFAVAVAGRRFAVRARRTGSAAGSLPFSSVEVERVVGARLRPHAARVDLGDPEVTVRLDVQPGRAFFFRDRVRGPEGLPAAFEGRAVALVSGGFDSVVAAWQILRRGVALDLVLCNLAGDEHRAAVLPVLKRLVDDWCAGFRPRLHVVDFAPFVRELRERCPEALWQVLLKRAMVRAAETVARAGGATAIVTGESVGQVSSQTLRNLAVIAQAAELPLLRPLAGANKEEITALARRIGTHALSATVPEYCALAGRRPATSAKLHRVVAAEARLDPDLLARLVARRAIVDLRALDLAKASAPDLEIAALPADATLVDLRSPLAFAGWHHPAAVNLDYLEALKTVAHLDKTRTYVFTCEVGLKSAHLAELLEEAGGHGRYLRLAALARAGDAPPAEL